MAMQQLSPQDHVAAVGSWARDAPVPGPNTAVRLALVLESLRGLGAVRRRVRAFLAASLAAGSDDQRADAIERAVLVIDELTSNALRHGAPPSQLHVADEAGRWVVVVTDSAPECRPAPAVDRPAGAGGYGLYVIADLTGAHGVHYTASDKQVWACIEKPPT